MGNWLGKPVGEDVVGAIVGDVGNWLGKMVGAAEVGLCVGIVDAGSATLPSDCDPSPEASPTSPPVSITDTNAAKAIVIMPNATFHFRWERDGGCKDATDAVAGGTSPITTTRGYGILYTTTYPHRRPTE